MVLPLWNFLVLVIFQTLDKLTQVIEVQMSHLESFEMTLTDYLKKNSR